MAEHNDFGILAEQSAQEYLSRKGYEILHTNWRYGHKELDIIARYNNMLIIVEVKARRSQIFGDPFAAVDSSKIRKIVSATNAYIKRYKVNLDVRYDILSLIHVENNKFEVEHIEDAFFSPVN